MAKKEPTLEWVDIDSLKPYEGNPRKNDVAVNFVKNSLAKFGFKNPILTDGDLRVCAGHTRLKAAKKLGLKKVPIIRNINSAEFEMYNIADNQTALLADWDDVLLAERLKEIREEDENFALDMGFDETFLERILEEEREGLTDPDEVPEEVEPITKAGDLYELGEHRLLCGDATKGEDVEKALNKEIPVLCLTDPPYSIGYENLKRRPDAPTRKEMGDSYKDPEDAGELLEGFIKNQKADVLVMTYPVNLHFQELANATKGYDLLYECVWVKHHFAFVIGRRYQPRHEPILIFRKKGKKGYFNVPANQSTVWECDKAAANKEHPTIKPIDLWQDLVKYQSREKDIVFDPFLGSGTTLIACEQLNRRCFGLEIEPKYCDVIVKRWENFTGGKARRAN